MPKDISQTKNANPKDIIRDKNPKNAQSKKIVRAKGNDTLGELNCWYPSKSLDIGVTDTIGISRPEMEDTIAFVQDFAGVRGQGFFAIFDGHAGKYASEFCGYHFHMAFLKTLMDRTRESVSRLFNRAYHTIDAQLTSRCLTSGGVVHAGSTAVTAFIRYEDEDRQQSFLPHNHPLFPRTTSTTMGKTKKGKGKKNVRAAPYPKEKPSTGKAKSKEAPSATTSSTAIDLNDPTAFITPVLTPIEPPIDAHRVLYTANAGDARAVLCRGGRALRLTYDHRGEDRLEARRVQDLGGFTMSGRVHGALAVTRSLGDPGLKEFVICAPFTSRVVLNEEDEFLILACDGIWDVMSDQTAVELIRNTKDADKASEQLVNYAIETLGTTDNVSVIVVRLKP